MNKQQVILLLVEGLGLSTGWRGNAVASSNAETFRRLQHDYIFFPLRSIFSNIRNVDSDIVYSVIGSGAQVLPDSSYVENEIFSPSFKANSAIASTIDHCFKHNTSLHLIGNLGDDRNRAGNIVHMLEIVKLALKKNLYNIFIHLVVDDSCINKNQVTNLLDRLEEDVASLGPVQIASITGESNLRSIGGKSVLVKSLNAIVNAAGKKCLSASQAIKQYIANNKPLSTLPASSIYANGKPITTINDFDGIIFYNFNNGALSSSISTLLGFLDNPKITLPHYLSVTSLLPISCVENEDLKVAFKRRFDSNLCQLLSEHDKSQLFISVRERKHQLERLFGNSDKTESIYLPALQIEDIHNSIENLLQKSIDNIANQSHDFYCIDLPMLNQVSMSGDYKETLKTMKSIDLCLLEFEKIALATDSLLILTSPFGNAEKMIGRTELEKYSQITNSPVPLILISKQTKKAEPVLNHTLYDIISSENSLIDIAPTVLSYFGIEKPGAMKGTDLLKDKKGAL